MNDRGHVDFGTLVIHDSKRHSHDFGLGRGVVPARCGCQRTPIQGRSWIGSLIEIRSIVRPE